MTLFNATEYLLDRHLAGTATATVPPSSAGPVTLTYAELADETRRVAAGLRAIGVRPEERIMLCMADGVELLTGILGAMYLGAVPVPVSTMVTGGELATVLADSRARVLCVSVEFADAARDRARHRVRGRARGARRPGRPRRHAVERRCATAGSPAAPYATWPDSPALWLYTSGTTGKPKGAMHRHGSVRDVAELYGTGVLGIDAGDRCLSVPKLFFAYGLGNSAFFPLAAGATTVLERARPTPQAMAALAARAAADAVLRRADVLLGAAATPTCPTTASPRCARRSRPASRCRRCCSTGSASGSGWRSSTGSARRRRCTSSCPTGPARSTRARRARRSAATAWRSATSTAMPIDAPGGPGDLFLSGPSVATGYWCRTETTRAVFQGEWLRTGDTYVRNEDGTYTCLGRSNDMLKAGGIWVSPAEVEERLLEHPDVAEVAVVAGRDADGLDKPIACVVPVAGRTLDPAALVQWCRDGLAAYKRPRAVVGLTELPKTATGKIRRNVLRELVADELIVRPVAAVDPPAVLT